MTIAAELTGDGFVDLAIAHGGADSVDVLENDGTGSFPGSARYGLDGSPTDLVAADFDRDGDRDVAVTTFSPAAIVILDNAGAGTLTVTATLPITLIADTTRSDPFPRAIGSADLDGDGLTDLVSANGGHRGAVSVFLGRAGGGFSAERLFGVGEDPRDLLITDVDADRTADLITVNRSSHDVSWLRGRGDGTFLREQRFTTGVSPNAATLFDLDRDGRDDLAVITFEFSGLREVELLVHE